jgi:hypothetical protein
MSEAHEWLFCIERYRNLELTHDADDYMVDGFILLRIPLPEDLERARLEPEMKSLILKLQQAENEKEVQENFPKFHAMRAEGGLWWVHLMRKDHKATLRQDFHTNSFTEEELLGIAPSEDPDLLPREMWFDRDGDPIEGPPDRMMAFLYN